MKRSWTVIVTLALALGGASGARAQVTPNSFQVVVQGGWQTYATGSGLKAGPTLAGEATYYLTTAVGVGLWTDFSAAESDGGLFTPAAFSYVDSTTFHSINQAVDVWQYGVHGKLQLPRNTAPFLLLGAGGYTLFLDPQQNSGVSSASGFVLKFGAGVDFAASEAVGIQLAVFDIFYPNWEPSQLQPVREEFQNSRFPELNPDPGKLSESVHSFKFVVGLTLVPGF